MINIVAERISERIPAKPDVALILGTGLGSLIENIEEKITIPYAELPGFPVTTAPSHKGQFLYGVFGEKKILAMQGRFHYYEGYSMQQVTFPIRVMKGLGIKNLIVTNASGSLREELQSGSIVMITDHINFMGLNPLIGPHEQFGGERFPSMHRCYSPELMAIAETVAEDEGIELKKGVYIGVTGPSMETASECRAFAIWGADVVGMSTVPEVIVAAHCNINVLGFSIVANMSNLFHKQSHEQQEIQETAKKSYPQVRTLIKKVVERM